MSPSSTTFGRDQPRGKSASFVSDRHIFPLFDVKNRCAFASSQITQKSIHAFTFSGCSSNRSVGLLQESGLDRSSVVENAGWSCGLRDLSFTWRTMYHLRCGSKKNTCGAQK